MAANTVTGGRVGDGPSIPDPATVIVAQLDTTHEARGAPAMTTTTYNVVAELDVPYGEDAADSAIELVADYAGAVARSDFGWTEVTFTIPATGLKQASTTALAILDTTPWGARSLRVLTTEDYDRMVDRVDAPMLTPAQAAEQLGISRQAVHKLITTQNLAARRVGTRWLVPADAVARRLETVQSR